MHRREGAHTQARVRTHTRTHVYTRTHTHTHRRTNTGSCVCTDAFTHTRELTHTEGRGMNRDRENRKTVCWVFLVYVLDMFVYMWSENRCVIAF